MRRNGLVEIHDHPSFPPLLRDLFTESLEAIWHFGNSYRSILPRLRSLLESVGNNQVLDLCSGGGGPWITLAPQLQPSSGLDPIHVFSLLRQISQPPGLETRRPRPPSSPTNPARSTPRTFQHDLLPACAPSFPASITSIALTPAKSSPLPVSKKRASPSSKPRRPGVQNHARRSAAFPSSRCTSHCLCNPSAGRACFSPLWCRSYHSPYGSMALSPACAPTHHRSSTTSSRASLRAPINGRSAKNMAAWSPSPSSSATPFHPVRPSVRVLIQSISAALGFQLIAALALHQHSQPLRPALLRRHPLPHRPRSDRGAHALPCPHSSSRHPMPHFILIESCNRSLHRVPLRPHLLN